ncbi:MAG: glycosyltransferase family 2 protein [Candidatus Omnitrophica bacterium]|nr:glycosyltransferase family 2 protein [Candidatus Omnitrophota bacterium]
MMFLRGIFWFCLFMVVYSYAVYPILLVLLDKIFKVKKRPDDPMDAPGITIIISAFNEEGVIAQRIENCLSLNYPKDKMEIIIASDGSNDKTNDIVRSYQDSGVILLDFNERRGKVNAINDAVQQAKNEIIVFSDANTNFAPDACVMLVRHFQDKTVGCVCGLLKFVNARGSRTAELEGVYWRYETLIKKMEGKRGALLGANGAIYAIRKKLFTICPKDTIIEDFIIPMRVLEKGFKVIYDPEAVAIEESAKHIIHEKKRRIRIGAGNYQALLLLWHMLNPLRGFSALAFWSHKVLRWFAPFALIGMLLLNVFLCAEPIYKVIFILQSVFYISAIIGQTLSWSGIQIKVFSLCYYFVSMNLALLIGFIRFMTGTQDVAWERTGR